MDEVRENREAEKKPSCRGKLFMGSNSSEAARSRPHRLFYDLGQSLYLDKYFSRTVLPEGCLQLSLWKQNSIDKPQRVGARYRILLDYDSICQIKKEAEDIKLALSLCDDSSFLGFCLHLGGLCFLTVEPDVCVVNLRKWYKPMETKGDPEGELKPSREGIMLSYDQFKRLIEFLDEQLLNEFPSFSDHAFICDKETHNPDSCPMCNVDGILPMQNEFKRFVQVW